MDSFFRRVFLAGAVWNLAGGLLIIIFSSWIFESARLSHPQPAIYYYSWIVLFMTFGVGYAMVWKNPQANRGIVVLGIVGKLAFSVVFLASMAASPHQIPRIFLIPVNGDLVFAGLFWAYLQSTANPVPPGDAPRAAAGDRAQTGS
jgi:hypothetical protein